ncbi:hypothetical protein D3C73_1353430 [compost metagenome]
MLQHLLCLGLVVLADHPLKGYELIVHPVRMILAVHLDRLRFVRGIFEAVDNIRRAGQPQISVCALNVCRIRGRAVLSADADAFEGSVIEQQNPRCIDAAFDIRQVLHLLRAAEQSYCQMDIINVDVHQGTA